MINLDNENNVNKLNKYLPIGSIVELKNNDKKFMITGYFSLECDDSIKIYDYVGCLYPEGLLLKNNNYSFNHEEIVKVIFNGYVSDEYNVLIANLLDKISNFNNAKEESQSENDLLLHDINDNNLAIDNIKLDDLNDISLNEHAVDIPKTDDDELQHTKLFYEFDENNFVTGVKEQEEKQKDNQNSNVDERTFVPAEPTNEEGNYNENQEFNIPHYTFDENGIIIN